MIQFDEIVRFIEDRIPLQKQESWDNSGVQISCSDGTVSKVLLALEITDDVIEEAVTAGAQMIITHHPLLFTDCKTITRQNLPGRYIVRLIEKGISVYSSHTCFDKAAGGTNDFMARKLELQNIDFMYDGDVPVDITRCGYLPQPVSPDELKAYADRHLELDFSRLTYCGIPEKISKIGLCSGAGSDFAMLAKANGCDAFITGDVKYHEAQTIKESGMNIIDAGHFGTEKFFPQAMLEIIRESNGPQAEKIKENIEFVLSKRQTDAFK